MTLELRGMAPLLLVRNFSAAMAFYQDVMGFRVVSVSAAAYAPGWALLQRGAVELMLNGTRDQAAGPAAVTPERAKGHADTALYFGCSDLDAAYQHFRDHGVELQPPVMTGYGFRSLMLSDPDGYTLVLHWPETEEAREDWARRYGMTFP